MSAKDLERVQHLRYIRVPPDQEIKRGWQTTTLRLWYDEETYFDGKGQGLTGC